MLPATNRGVGMNIGFPDVCLTPVGPTVVPIPYPNFAMTAQAVAFSPVVRVSGVHALNLGSVISMTSGDEPGVAHWTIKGPGRYIMGNPIVYIDRLPAINLTCPSTGNTANNALGACLVPSAVNVFYTYAFGESPAAAPTDVRRWGEEMLGRTEKPMISWSMLDATMGYVRVELLTTDLAQRFHVAMMDLGEQGANALVIDLRDCPGGDLDAAVEWAARFLPENVEIVRLEDADGDELIRRTALAATYTIPLTIFINEGTASAAEIFVASMQAHGRARIIGRPTFGKTTVQRWVPSDAASYTYTTVAQCTGPNGISFVMGIVPDEHIAPGAEESVWHQAAQADRSR